MDPRSPKQTSTVHREPDNEQELAHLRSLALHERIVTVFRDIETRADRYACIDPFDLAEVLGLDAREHDANEWPSGTSVPIRTLEDRTLEGADLFAEHVEVFEGYVTAERYAELEVLFEELADAKAPSFERLLPNEKERLERHLAAEDLDNLVGNGIGGTASLWVEADGLTIDFLAHIGDLGECEMLDSPYELRDNPTDEREQLSSED